MYFLSVLLKKFNKIMLEKFGSKKVKIQKQY